MKQPVVSLIMGSKSDDLILNACAEILRTFEVAFEKKVVSAHRTPVQMMDYAQGAQGRGIQIIIAGAGGAAHLPGMVAALTPLPVIGVPIQTKALNGLDSLYSIVQMPAGVPVMTMAIGEAGAKNAAYSAIAILALHDAPLAERYRTYKEKLAQTTWEQQFK